MPRPTTSDPLNSSDSVTGFELNPPRRTTPALLLSLGTHVLLLTTIGLIWTQKPKGTGELADRPVGIALVHRMPDRDQYTETADLPQINSESTEQSESSSSAAASAPPADLSPPIDMAGVLQAMKATPAPVSGSGLAGETNLDGDAFSQDRGASTAADAGQTTTTVFGVSGSGSRFVYVFDRSDSMNGFSGKPLRTAKRELIRSLKSLSERQRFQIIFYNDKPSPFKIGGMPLQMVAGEPSYIDRAESYIRSISAFGGTEHEGALKMALRMGPDVIFFLTDASIPRLSNAEMREIKHRADSVGTTIHCIEFGVSAAGSPGSFLRDLAAQNNGKYRYVDVRGLDATKD